MNTNLPANPDVSVIILTKNSAATIVACLESVIEEKPGEVLVVDGMSTDGTPDLVRSHSVRVISDASMSLGESRQLGVETATGVYVMFVDSDAVLTPTCIGTMRRELERYGWAGIHAKLLSAENVTYWQRAEQEGFSRYYGRAGPKDRIDTIVALFRREVLLRYPFDANLRESCEDIDLCRRLVENNQKLGVSNAEAYHYHRREFIGFAKQRFRNGLGDARFGFKYHDTRIFIDPLLTIVSTFVRNMLSRRINLVPYWFAGGLSEFLGVLVGLSRARRPLISSPASQSRRSNSCEIDVTSV